MSPMKFLDGDHKQQAKSGVMINGLRPTPLKIKQESHTIHKQQQPQRQMIRKPIIIYTTSPKVIHTKPQEFMALVQKLTGKSSSKDHEQKKKNNKTLEDGYGVSHETNGVMKSKSPMFDTPLNPFAYDVPLFTPNSSDYLFSPHSFLKLSDVVSSSPNKTNSF